MAPNPTHCLMNIDAAIKYATVSNQKLLNIMIMQSKLVVSSHFDVQFENGGGNADEIFI